MKKIFLLRKCCLNWLTFLVSRDFQEILIKYSNKDMSRRLSRLKSDREVKWEISRDEGNIISPYQYSTPQIKLHNWRKRNSREHRLTGIATQSSSSARGDSEQKVPSVRKGGRGGGGNRNSGGGPGHSGHSVLSSVSSSSILHLSVLKNREYHRLILLTKTY